MMHPNHAWRMFVSLARKCALAEGSGLTLTGHVKTFGYVAFVSSSISEILTTIDCGERPRLRVERRRRSET